MQENGLRGPEYHQQARDKKGIRAADNLRCNSCVNAKSFFHLAVLLAHYAANAADAVVDVAKLAACYLEFEKKRREFNSRPEVLIEAVGGIRSLIATFIARDVAGGPAGLSNNNRFTSWKL